MSKLYGTLTNEQSKTSTRAAHRIITACAQSYAGSVAVTIRFDNAGREIVEIATSRTSESDPSFVILSCELIDLLAVGLVLAPANEENPTP